MMSATTNQDAAVAFATQGWAIFPVWWVQDGTCACQLYGGQYWKERGCDEENAGKHMMSVPEFGITSWRDHATSDVEVVRQIWAHAPFANIGFEPGKSGLVAIDIDPRNGGDESLEDWEKLNSLGKDGGPAWLPPTRTSITGSGGYHYFYRLPAGVTQGSGNNWLPGVDIKSTGGYVVLPPSFHKSGDRYRWDSDAMPVADLPVELLPFGFSGSKGGTRAGTGTGSLKPLTRSTEDVLANGFPKGGVGDPDGLGRDEGLFKLACRLRAQMGPDSKDDVLRMVKKAAKACRPEVSAVIAQDKVDSAFSYSYDGDEEKTEAMQTLEVWKAGSREQKETTFEWPDLSGLDRHGPAWPGGILPGMEPWVDCVAEELQVPKGMVALALLSGISVAVRRRLLIKVKASWTEPFNVYTMSVAAPGELKTPTLKRVMGPLAEREAAMKLAVKDKVREWHDEYKVLKKTVDHASSKIASCDNASDRAAWRIRYDSVRDDLLRHEMARPLDPRIFIEDATPEAANSVMAGQRGVIAVMSSEGGFMENVLGRYSKTTNINGLLKSWDGVEAMVIDRVGKMTEAGDGSVVVPSPYMTIGLLVQPRVLEVMGESEDVVGKGLSARFLYCVPDSKVGDRATDPTVDWTGVWAWRQVEEDIERCLSSIDNIAPFEMQVTREAAELFKDARVRWERDRRADGRLAPVVDWSNKLASHVVRVAGAIALLRIVCMRTGPWMITDDDMRRALAFGEWQVDHAVCAYQVMGAYSGSKGASLKALATVLKTLVSEGVEEVPHTDLRARLSGRRMTTEEVHDVACEAEKRGWLLILHPDSGNFKHNKYRVNPNVVSL